MESRWSSDQAELEAGCAAASDASSVVSSSSTLVGEPGSKVAAFPPVRPHRRAISALAIGRTMPGPAGALGPVGAIGSARPVGSPSSVNSAGSAGSQSPQTLPFLMRSNSNPSLPSFKAKEMRLPLPEGAQSMAAVELVSLLDSEPAEKLLVLDVRPFVDFCRATIQNALHVCLPSTLLRRKTFTLERLVDNLPEDVRQIVKPRVMDPEDCSDLKIVIFDNTAQQMDSGFSVGCHGMASKFVQSPKWATVEARPSVYILESGFAGFKEFAPECVKAPVVTLSSPINSNSSPTDLSGAPNMMPKPKFSNHSVANGSPSSIPESPLSSSSPVSGLLKFQLPASNGLPPPFKIARNEEVLNLESYLSAVDLGEKQRSLGGSISSLENLDLSSPPSNTAFKFPTDPSSINQINLASGNGIVHADKLNFQKSFIQLHILYDRNMINSVVPRWFQDLAHEPKLEMISQFQKIDLLEKKRLSHCLSNAYQPSRAQTASYAAANSCDTADLEHSNRFCPSRWLDEYDSDEEDQNICVSSGVELGTKNRYKDIFPYEHTRVVLKKTMPVYQHHYANEIFDTYINANYLTNPFVRLQTPPESDCLNVRYIATQAPLEATIHDFYTCILNNNVPLVLSLTDEFENGVEKCYKFWAEGNYDGIRIKLLQEHDLELPDVGPGVGPVTLRRIQIIYNENQTFETLQIQVKDWPDLGVMVNPRQILEMICLKNIVIRQMFERHAYSHDHFPTILVHCSAGCGRTGTLCTLDTVLSNMSKFDSLKEEWIGRRDATEYNPWSPRSAACLNSKLFDPVIITINKFRKQRISMVQNVNQYLFIYDCLLSFFDMRLKEKAFLAHTSNPFRKTGKGLEIIESFLGSKTREAGL